MLGLGMFVKVWLVGWDSSVEERTQLCHSMLHNYSNVLYISLHTSVYLCIPLHISVYLCISLYTSPLLSPRCTALPDRSEVRCTVPLFIHHQWESPAKERSALTSFMHTYDVQCTYLCTQHIHPRPYSPFYHSSATHTHTHTCTHISPSSPHPSPCTCTRCTERFMSQITEQVENGTLPNMAENLLNSSPLRKGAEPSLKATNDAQSLLSTPSDIARHKRVLCSNYVGEDGKDTNRKARARGQQRAITGRTIKRHIAAVDEGMKTATVSLHTFPSFVNHPIYHLASFPGHSH